MTVKSYPGAIHGHLKTNGALSTGLSAGVSYELPQQHHHAMTETYLTRPTIAPK